MEKQKNNRMKAILAGILCIACVVVIVMLVYKAPDILDSAEDTTAYEDLSLSTEPMEETLEFVPYFTMDLSDTEETTPPAVVSNGVTIQQVPKDPNEVINYAIDAQPGDPEYVQDDTHDYIFSEEGRVYRNDKVISIPIVDKAREKTYTVSFGVALGTCNRFLYLNPTVTSTGEEEDYYFYIEYPIGGGQTANFNHISEAPYGGTNYTFFRTMDQRSICTYMSPDKPGAVWYTGISREGPIYINFIIYNDLARMIASVQLCIEKDPTDGTYSITDLDDNNILVQNEDYPQYTEEELDYIVKFASDTLHNLPDYTVMYYDPEIYPEKCIVQIRPMELGLIFDEIIPVSGQERSSWGYNDSGIQILSVTYNPTAVFCDTMYFYIICPPVEGEHGIYQYIGRDYYDILTEEGLSQLGYHRID